MSDNAPWIAFYEDMLERFPPSGAQAQAFTQEQGSLFAAPAAAPSQDMGMDYLGHTTLIAGEAPVPNPEPPPPEPAPPAPDPPPPPPEP